MAKTVVGLFNHIEDARGAVQDLIDHGFRREDLSLVAHDPAGEYARQMGIEVHPVTDEDESAESDRSGTVTGASIGAAAGGIAGLLAGLGLLMIPGIGPVIAAGPLAAALGGAGIGAVTGGMIGALAEAGVPEEEAKQFAESVRSGNILVMVNVENDGADRAAEIINRHHPIDLGQNGEDVGEVKWQGFNEDVEPFAFVQKEPPYKEREPGSRLDYGPGARSYLQGQPVAAVDREFADMSNYQNERTGNWKTYEARFRADFREHYEERGRRWEDYREAYRFGFDEAQRDFYANSTWERVQQSLREFWEARYIGKNWSDYEHAVRQGWEVGHTPS